MLGSCSYNSHEEQVAPSEVLTAEASTAHDDEALDGHCPPRRRSARVKEIGSEVLSSPACNIGKEAVGRRLKVRWDDASYYNGRVVEFNSVFGTHLVVYDDGDQRYESLRASSLVWEFLDAVGDTTKSNPKRPRRKLINDKKDTDPKRSRATPKQNTTLALHSPATAFTFLEPTLPTGKIARKRVLSQLADVSAIVHRQSVARTYQVADIYAVESYMQFILPALLVGRSSEEAAARVLAMHACAISSFIINDDEEPPPSNLVADADAEAQRIMAHIGQSKLTRVIEPVNPSPSIAFASVTLTSPVCTLFEQELSWPSSRGLCGALTKEYSNARVGTKLIVTF